MSNPHRAEVVGSLLRPGFLSAARQAHDDNRLSTVELKRIEDRAVDEVIARQEGAGLDVITDGEMRRASFTGPLSETITGLEAVSGVLMPWRTPDGEVEAEMPLVVTGKVTRRRSVVAEEYSYIRGRARGPVKVTVPSPLMMFPMWSPEHSPAAYADPFEMFADAVDVVRSEVLELAALGCTYVQVDAPELATLVEPRVRDWYASRGMPADRLLTEGIELIDAVVADVPGVRFAIHLCRGNNAGMWMAEGGYDHIAKALFGRAKSFDTFLLEYDDGRSGSFEPLRDVPGDKMVVLGLVSTKKAELESAVELKARIDAAARFFDHEQMALSTQCGFASSALGNPIGEEAQDAKLGLVAEVAHDVWH